MFILSPLLTLRDAARRAGAAVHRDPPAHVGVPGELGRAAAGRRRRHRRRGVRDRRPRREGLRPGAAPARPAGRRVARLFGSRVRLVHIQARLQPPLQTIPALGRSRCWRSAAGSRSTATSRLGMFLAFSTYVLPAHAAGPAARGHPHGRPARPRRRRTHLRAARLHPARAGQARRDGCSTVTHGEIAFDARDVRLPATEPVLQRLLADGRAGRDGRARSARRARASRRSALLLPRFYDVHGGRDPIDGTDVRDVTLDSLRRRSASCSRTRSSSPTRSAPTSRSAGPTRPTRRSRPPRARPRPTSSSAAARRVRHGRRRAGAHALGRAASADRARPRAAHRPADPRARRRDLGRRRRVEDEIHPTLRRIAAARTTILIAHRRSTLSSPTASSWSTRATSSTSGTHDELRERCRCTASCSRVRATTPKASTPRAEARRRRRVRSTASRRTAWSGLDADGAAQRSRSRRAGTAAVGAGVRVAGGGGGGGGDWAGGGMGGALAPTPELLAKVDALPPAAAEPAHRRRGARAAPRRRSGSPGSSSRSAAGCRSGFVLVALDALATLAGPLLLRLGIDHGVASTSTEALWRWSPRVFLAVTLARLVGDVGATPASWAGPPNGCCTRCGSRSSPTSSASASTTTTARWRAGS